ncbi:hypothetical protein BRETT_000085 [Brettanomyces bruxellensis]|uniref:Major facilitator superfamily (MFS) profile domain-containing protein n=1 Tax=Dekkera bruxellensis TaxID=5007 RepID=A0A871QZH0_DEKBR|nr:uncharacterized protein BRETT_000085 [Brettanomyces bruxellensis]QOU18359.1 hypothetical protein BRETT_000085 [Brettanomyces bruxellensis]
MSDKSVITGKEGQTREINCEFPENASDDPISYDEEGRAGRFRQKKSWSDIFTIICSGCALLSDGYQNSCMNMLNSVFSVGYPKAYTSSVKTRVSNALMIGEIIGQITVGLTCDYYGRRWAILATTSIIVVGSILAAAMHGSTVTGMFWMLTVARGVTGFGVGGEYPASSTSAAEASNEATKRRGGVIVLVTNLPLSLGGPFALIVFLIVYAATGYGKHLLTCARILLGIGCIWPLAVFYFRWKMATPLLYRKSAIKRKVPYLLSIRFYWKKLIGTAVCWFMYDFITFPNGVFSSTIIASVLDDTTDLTKVAEWNLLLAVFSIPGVLVGAYLVDRIGRKYTMCIGFGGYVVMGLIIGCAYNKIKKIVPLFIIFYALFTALGNGGPGDVLGLASAESYASPIRGTFYGFCAAFGKAGAAIGTQVFTPIQNHLGKNWTFIIAAICGAVGVTLCYLFVPHLKDPDLMVEDVKYLRYVRAHGWTGTFGIKEEQREIKSKDIEATEDKN